MSDLRSLAHHIDRLVWAVGGQIRGRHRDLPASSVLSPASFSALVNVVAYPAHLTEAFLRRRYVYRPEDATVSFLTELERGGYMDRRGEQLTPTERLEPIANEVAVAAATAGRDYWQATEKIAFDASAMARAVLDRAEGKHGLVAAAQQSPEGDDPYHRLWQRLCALRLVRNEAHVEAWRATDLTPAEVEALTNAWSGTPLQAPITYSEELVSRGYVLDGVVTASGIAVREQIEEGTDAGVTTAFSAVDVDQFSGLLAALAPAT